MRFLHVSDLHIGKHVNEFSLAEDQRHILAQIIGLVRTHHVDALLIAGDVYDKSSPSAEAVALFDWFLAEVAETDAACFIVAGNHDSAERIAYARTLLSSRNVFISPVFDGTLAHHTLHDEHGPVTFWLMPFCKPALVRPFYPDREIGTDYTAACLAVLEENGMGPQSAQDGRNVILAHQFVTSSGQETLRSDSELSLGGMDNVDVSVFDAFDYVALGHVHRPQRICRDEARYSGSPLKYSFSEARYPKSVPLVELGPKGTVKIELIPLEPLHDMREIKGPLNQLVAPETLEASSAHEREDYLHVTLTDEMPPLDAMATLRTVYPNVMALDYDNARTRAAGVEGEAANIITQRINPAELFAQFYEKQNGMPLSDDQESVVRDALGNLKEV